MSLNYFITDKVKITNGKGLHFMLVLGKDKRNAKAECEYTYKKAPTWKELCDDLISYCKDENICLSYLAEQGTIQQGPGRSGFAPCAIKYIAGKVVSA